VTFPLVLQGNRRSTNDATEGLRVKHNLEQSGPFIGIGGLAVAAFLYGYSAFVAPSLLHSIVMPLIWLAFFVLACRWFTRRPVAVVVLPALAVVVWFGLLVGFGASA
jgi:hypothetical protein